ncbi:MAG: acetate--CoA ligase alpha subunit [Chloroflexota bacterium]
MLEALFYPRSVAVVGAAREEGKLGHAVLANIINFGFECPIYPVNPKADELMGLKAYPSVLDIPGSVDLGVIVVPPKAVAGVVRDCGQKGARAVIVITAGFREIGPEGVLAEKEVVRYAKEAGMRLLGPNCLGLINTENNLDATFARNLPLKGSISFMTQSGALATAILDWADRERVGFSKFVSLGNKADVNENDLIEAWRDDEASRVVIAYLEGIADGARFMKSAKTLTKKKPLIMVKSGGTAAGSRAVSSHTGTLAGSDTAYDAAFKQTGVIRARSVENLFDLSIAFAYQPLPSGRRLAIITNAGGPGIMATDAAERLGLTLASFTPETIAALRVSLPPTAALYNPVDVIGDARADRYRAALETVVRDPGVDSVLVLLTPQAMTQIEETARTVVEVKGHVDKPILTSFMGGTEVAPGLEILRQGGVPNYSFPERAVAALSAMSQYREWKDRPEEKPRRFRVDKAKVASIIRDIRGAGRDSLGDVDALQVFAAYGIPVPVSRLSHSPDESVKIADEIGYPVVMKIVSPDILHKSDVGGVRIGLTSAEEVRAADVAIMANARRYAPDAEIRGINVQWMVPRGRETILGVTRDPTFGHLIAFGLGGIYVEVLKDVAFRVAPLTPADAAAMIQEIRSYLLLRGVRGEEPADIEAIVDALLRLSQLVVDFPEISELDINPLMVMEQGHGAIAVDGRMILG